MRDGHADDQAARRAHARPAAGRAAEHGRSVEAEVRAILDAAVNLPEQNLLLTLHAAVAEVGAVDLGIPPRTDRPRPVELA
ncbi:MAG: toxin-antitoxin system antitoxin subunit [Nocardioides sp.]